MTQLTKNFTLEELLQLDKNHGETPSETVILNLTWGAKYVLQPLRDKTGLPIISRVCWRGPTRNKLAGSTNSEHPNGQADDIDIPPLTNDQIIQILRESDIPFHKAIDERLYQKDGRLSEWIHLSWRRLGANQKPSRIFRTARNTKENLKAVYDTV